MITVDPQLFDTTPTPAILLTTPTEVPSELIDAVPKPDSMVTFSDLKGVKLFSSLFITAKGSDENVVNPILFEAAPKIDVTDAKGLKV